MAHEYVIKCLEAQVESDLIKIANKQNIITNNNKQTEQLQADIDDYEGRIVQYRAVIEDLKAKDGK